MHSTVQKPSMGILQLSEGEKKFQLTRYVPSEPLRPFIKHYWIVSWDLDGQDPYFQDVVPNPCVNMVIEAYRSGIYGVASRKYTKKIEGKGRVFGVKFQPGGFYPFIQSPLSGLTDQSLTIESVFGAGALAFEQAIASEEDASGMIGHAEVLFLQKLPAQDETIAFINQIINCMNEDREVTRVEQICELFDINKRKLQRLFNQYVGVSPKWVIKLYRLQNAAEAMDTGSHRNWLTLSNELGYYDQSHFIKDFKSIIGKTPDEYARSVEQAVR
ncbi:MAG: DUF6597 domain-containing transcriptional factor [Bacillota bacterium]